MKLFNIAPLALMSTALLGNAPQQVSALSCGISGVTKSCLGDSDVRYDADASYGLKDQDAMWENIAGLYIFTEKRYEADGTPSADRGFTGLPGTWDWSEYTTYANITVSGSRFYYHLFNMVKNNDPGLPGIVIPLDIYCKCTWLLLCCEEEQQLSVQWPHPSCFVMIPSCAYFMSFICTLMPFLSLERYIHLRERWQREAARSNWWIQRRIWARKEPDFTQPGSWQSTLWS